MGIKDLFFASNEIDFDNIVSVVIIDEVHIIKNQAKYGMIMSKNDWMPTVTTEPMPSGTECTFSITYRNGDKKIVKRRSMTKDCDRLMQFVLDPPQRDYDISIDACDEPEENDKKKTSKQKLEKNQLPRGEYIIGKDIPPGKYDFDLVFGNGSLDLKTANPDRKFCFI